MSQNHSPISGKKLFFTIILNLLITISQIIGGILSGSLALITDAAHNFTDVLSLVISYVANRISRREQTIHQTFGLKRAEIIAAFINSISLIIIAVILGIEAIKRFNNIKEVDSDIVLILASIAILGNGLSVLLLKTDAKHNLNIKSAFLHLFTDFMISVAVLIGALAMKFYQIYWIDPLITLIIAIYLIYLSRTILLDSLKILMLFAPKEIKIEDIETEFKKIKPIKNIHHVHLWQLNENDIYFEAHIQFYENISLVEFDTICKQLEKILLEKFGIQNSFLQPEFERDDVKEFIIQD